MGFRKDVTARLVEGVTVLGGGRKEMRKCVVVAVVVVSRIVCWGDDLKWCTVKMVMYLRMLVMEVCGVV